MKYICVNGDTWDSVSFKVYGTEFMYDIIMNDNRQYSDVIVFGGGETLSIADSVSEGNIDVYTTSGVSVIKAPWE
jgi:hypothetical protein